jgi:hypothetical protein
MCLADLAILDLTPRIAAEVDLHPNHSVLPARLREEYITLHYSGPSEYPNRTHDAELNTLVSEARYQVNHNYAKRGNPPAYPDGPLYDFAVISDGTIVRLRSKRVQLWHAGNGTANERSWSVHVPLGGRQNLTDAQRAGLFLLFDALRVEGSAIPRANVVAHCEWPRVRGNPIRSNVYRLLPEQSACPGSVLFAHIPAYRSLPDQPPRYRVRVRTAVYEVPRVEPRRIALGGTAHLAVGQEITIDSTYPNGMAHLVGGLGFVELANLDRL